MIDELFEIPETLSPKEAWKRKHGVATFEPNPEGDTAEEREKWTAVKGVEATVYGWTEVQALMRMAHKLKVEFYR